MLSTPEVVLGPCSTEVVRWQVQPGGGGQAGGSSGYQRLVSLDWADFGGNSPPNETILYFLPRLFYSFESPQGLDICSISDQTIDLKFDLDIFLLLVWLRAPLSRELDFITDNGVSRIMVQSVHSALLPCLPVSLLFFVSPADRPLSLRSPLSFLRGSVRR